MSIFLEVYIQPGAKKTAISGKHGDCLKIRLNAAPVDGKANQALINFMAQILTLKKQDIEIIRGKKSRFKLLSIQASVETIEKLRTFGFEPKC